MTEDVVETTGAVTAGETEFVGSEVGGVGKTTGGGACKAASMAGTVAKTTGSLVSGAAGSVGGAAEGVAETSGIVEDGRALRENGAPRTQRAPPRAWLGRGLNQRWQRPLILVAERYRRVVLMRQPGGC